MRALAFIALACVCLGACAPSPASRTTRLQAEDVLDAAVSVREQLAQSAFVRGARAQPAVLLPVMATNRSDDRLTEGERWIVTSGVARNPEVLALFERSGIAVQVPPIDPDLLRRYGLDPEANASANAPTHLFTAEVASIARAADVGGAGGLDERRDTYVVRYQIVEMDGRRVVWTGSAELARRASGLLID